AAALHFRHGKAAAGREYRISGSMCRILGQKRRGHCDAVTHRVGGLRCEQGLATQDAVLVGKRKPNDLDFFFLYDALDSCRDFCLGFGPQAMTFDETGGLTRTRHYRSAPIRPTRRFALARLAFLPIALPVV